MDANSKLNMLLELTASAAKFRDSLCVMQSESMGWNASLRHQLIDCIREADQTHKVLVEALVEIERSQEIARRREKAFPLGAAVAHSSSKTLQSVRELAEAAGMDTPTIMGEDIDVLTGKRTHND